MSWNRAPCVPVHDGNSLPCIAAGLINNGVYSNIQTAGHGTCVLIKTVNMRGLSSVDFSIITQTLAEVCAP